MRPVRQVSFSFWVAARLWWCAAIIIALVATTAGTVQAQYIREHNQATTRSFHGEKSRIRRSFQSDTEARAVLRQVLEAAGLTGMEDRILLRATSETAAAEAFIEKNNGVDERLIAYNAEFMQELRKQSANYWSQVAVLAHEVGHHIRFHTIIDGRNHEFELEADYQAGFILRRLGASLDEAKSAFTKFPLEATESHPGRADRLQAVTLGWTDGQGARTAQTPSGLPTSPVAGASRVPEPQRPTPWSSPPPNATGVAPKPAAQPQLAMTLPPQAQPPAPTPAIVPSLRGCPLSARQKGVDAGGRATFALQSSCGPIGDVSIRYGAYQFRQRQITNNGQVDIAFDLFAGPGRITFETASTDPVSLEAQGGGTQGIVKYILIWNGEADLDLHVLQYGARMGEADHVWIGRPRSLIEAQSGTSGFISSADDGAVPGDHAEVFTFIKTINHRRGGMQIRVDFKSRGDVASGDFCGAGAKARIEYRLLRHENGRTEPVKSGFFRALDCGTRIAGDGRYAPITLIRFD